MAKKQAKIDKLKKKVKKLKAQIKPALVDEPKTSPLAPVGGFPVLPTIAGVEFSAVAAGVKYQGRNDVMLAKIAAGSSIAGVFTQSSTRSASVLDCQAKLAQGIDSSAAAALLVNSGNSNAFTGGRGLESVKAICDAVATELDIPSDNVFTASTGVIGQPLPHDRIVAKIAELSKTADNAQLEPAARAIMTTDTFPKGASANVEIGGKTVQISGFAKGSGMIAPDMATMLVYIFTDAAIDQPVLQQIVSKQNDASFNSITVDSDTSTSDSLMVVATGQSGAPRITDMNSSDGAAFTAALRGVMMDLAHLVVRDGEGATKFVTVTVTGAQSDADARQIALSIANSPLVKTAIAGQDPNWGRVVMAVGKSGAAADRDKLAIWFGDILVAENGWVSPDYTEAAGAEYMRQTDLEIRTDIGLGQGRATVWTCDLTHQYITINADYRS